MNIAVLGVGEHGRTIAQLCATHGCSVRLWAEDATAVMDAVDRVEQELTESHPHDSGDNEHGAHQIEGTTGLEAAVGGSDIVIETATDDVGELQRKFAAIEQHVTDDAIILTAHPELSVTAATAGMRQPERALGLQFVTTEPKPLVEVVVTEHYSEEVIADIDQFITTIGATAVFIRDSAGLASTRLTLALEVEAMWLVADGVASVSAVDRLYERMYSQSIGPLERADRAGLAERREEIQRLAETIGDRYEPPPLLDALVEAGYTGQDAGEGFYKWDGDEPTGEAIEGPHFEHHESTE